MAVIGRVDLISFGVIDKENLNRERREFSDIICG
jgi:hypothetical protein